MADVEENESPEPLVPPISDTNLDDAGELDYEPSEPSANSIKEAVSDDEEEGEAGDSTDERKASNGGIAMNKQQSIDAESDGQPDKPAENDDEFSGPEEGEVDELEEGEVKEESDQDDDEEQTVNESRIPRAPATGHRFQESNHPKQPISLVQHEQKRRVQVTGPSGDVRMRVTAPDNDTRPEDAGVCKFYLRGQCTWGSFCKFLHPTGDQALSTLDTEKGRRSLEGPAPATAPVPLMAVKADPPAAVFGSESAWERGLKQARERIKKASEKKEVDPDFEHKRLTMPLGPAVAILDEPAAPADFRSGPRPLMDFGRNEGERTSVGNLPGSALPSRGLGEYAGREPSGNTLGYERRQHPPVALDRSSRDSMDETYLRSGYGTAKRDRQHTGRGDYVPAARVHRASPEMTSQSALYYHHRHSSSTTTDYIGQPDGRRTVERDEKELQRRRLEPEPQGWEFRRSPPAYYHDRNQEYDRAQDGPAVARRNYDGDRGYRENEPRRLPAQQQQQQQQPQQQQQRGGPIQNRNNQQQQENRPANYHYYRTLQQQQQRHQDRDRHRTSGQERKSGGDQDDRERSRSTRGRNEYNYHYYSSRDQKSHHQDSGSRPLPYERPSYNRQDQQSQWRDPWRRSPSPRGRHGAGDGAGRVRNSSSPDAGRSGTNSPVGREGMVKRQRPRSLSSSASGSSRSSHTRSSHASHRRQTKRSRASPSLRAGQGSGGPRRAGASSRNSDEIPNRNVHRSRSPAASSRGSKQGRGRTSSRDRSPTRAGRVGNVRDSSDVASRAAAKALGDRRSRSPSPRYRRLGSAAGSSDRSSVASRGSPVRKRSRTPVRAPSSDSAGQTSQARPLSPPPPAPFLATHVTRKSTENSRQKQSSATLQQRTEQNRQPIKMTIVSKSKVRTNIYESAQEAGGSAGALFSMDDEDEGEDTVEHPVLSRAEPQAASVSPATSDTGPAMKRAKLSSTESAASGGSSDNRVMSRREELLRQLRAVESAIDAKRRKEKEKD